MNRSNLRLAAYLDEAGEEPLSACKTIVDNNIKHVILRDAWTNNICDIPDSAHGKLNKILKDFGLSPLMVASNLGKINVEKLLSIQDKDINHCINICKYYNCEYLRIFAGETEVNRQFNLNIIDEWIRKISNISAANGIKCLYETTSRSAIFKAVDIIQTVLAHSIDLIYDPANLLARNNFDPFIKHWTLLKNKVQVIDVRDIKIGHGFKVAGYGDTRIDMTIRDALESRYSGWFAIEPSLGRRHGSANSKSESFVHAVEALDVIIKKL
jgi:sugar phosphate isomerase/epimerase